MEVLSSLFFIVKVMNNRYENDSLECKENIVFFIGFGLNEYREWIGIFSSWVVMDLFFYIILIWGLLVVGF